MEEGAEVFNNYGDKMLGLLVRRDRRRPLQNLRCTFCSFRSLHVTMFATPLA